jgi:cytochrome c-type biogenesis protein CcmH
MLCSLPSSAAIETYEFDTPQQEALYKELIEELRCLVCQNQNLADSNAELATDLRRKTYEMVKQDQGRNEIVTYMVQRYGDFVLYRPPVKSSTLLLWIGPFVIMAIGLYVLFNMVRRQGRAPLRQLSEEEAAKANALLHGTEDREDRS